MLDQIFGRLFLSQWIVFAVLLVLLVGLSELAWRIGLARSTKKSEADKESGTVRSAVLALLGLLLGFSFALAGARHETRRELFIASLNETIDLEAKRVAAKRNHVPGAVWLLLLCVAGCGLWLVSYPAGTSGRHSILERFVFPILIAIVIAIITDIDTPRAGLISLDERPLLELNETLSRASATKTP
jgi:hypothetical protein